MKIVIRVNVGVPALLAWSSALACGGVGYQAGGPDLAVALLSIAIIAVVSAHWAGGDA